MIWQKLNSKIKILLTFLGIILVTWFVAGCGVKGDPLPPEKPADLGRGKPTYKRAAEKLHVETTPRRQDDDEDEDKDKDNDEDRDE